MGAAYTCVGVISLVAAFGFRNLEADSTLLTQLLQVALQDKVQKAQMVAVLTGFMGAVGTIVAAVLFQQKIPTPLEYVLSLYNHDVVIVDDKDMNDEVVVEIIRLAGVHKQAAAA
mmetsp:Transcript_41998/g.46745  ORF Transcript_41998/g.46745 Transcript_41998/m.46745 type:complete len:115 (+) Transcript_41998:156-500(+)